MSVNFVLPIVNLTDAEKTDLSTLDSDFSCKAGLTTLSTAAATFLCVGALLIIGCSLLCLQLEGINAMQDLFYPAILPSLCAIVISIPFIIISVINSQKKNELREEIFDKMGNWVEKSRILGKSKEDQINYVEENFLNPKWSISYRTKLLTDFKETFPKNENKGEDKSKWTEEEIFVDCLDKLIAKINKNKKKKDAGKGRKV